MKRHRCLSKNNEFRVREGQPAGEAGAGDREKWPNRVAETDKAVAAVAAEEEVR